MAVTSKQITRVFRSVLFVLDGLKILAAAQTVLGGRKVVESILKGIDDRILVVGG
jgi:3-deoxy-D-arabino-heptulosonate 7-phosphate (DAHP) synthase